MIKQPWVKPLVSGPLNPKYSVKASRVIREEGELADLIAAARTRHAGRTLLLCEEAAPQSRDYYIPCSAPAVKFVLSERGRVVYAMCAPCASHNIKNRGCEDAGAIEKTR